MVLAKTDLWGLYKGLQYNFLYNNDIDSIHILLNLYDLEAKITNICPKYICTSEIRKRVKRILLGRRDRQLISNNIAMLIHEDINRLELTLYLEGYKDGYYNKKWVNIIEGEAIKHFSVDKIYEKNFLFHYETTLKDIVNIKKDFWSDIEEREKESKYLYHFVKDYCEKIIKGKVFSLNKYIDKQLTIEYNLNKLNIQEEGSFLSANELNKIYKAVFKTIMKNAITIYKNACWFGVNDGVLNRYS
ncbi:MAG: hypothetical protein GXY88_05670 [Tissierellia bacterium]|nr:hypothetical protein [Tissierellia bacterium]